MESLIIQNIKMDSHLYSIKLTSSSFHKPGTANDSNKSPPHNSLTLIPLFWFESLTSIFSKNLKGINEVSTVSEPFNFELNIKLS